MKFSGRFKSRLEANVGSGGCVSARFEPTNLRRSGLMPIARRYPFSPARRKDSRHGGDGYSRLPASRQRHSATTAMQS